MASIIWSNKPYQLTNVVYSTATLVYGNSLPVTLYTQGYPNGANIYYSLSGHETGTGSAVISHYFGDLGTTTFNIPTTIDYSNAATALAFTIHDQNAYNASTQLVPNSNTSTSGIILAAAPYNIVISANKLNFNLNTELTALGATLPVTVNVTINSGVYVWSNSTGIAAFATGSVGAGSTINITNNGYIIGKGGAGGTGGVGTSAVMTAGAVGGPAIDLSANVTIVNNSYIGGGGGGGGSAQGISPQGTNVKVAGSVGGGGGAGGGVGGAAQDPGGSATGGSAGAVGAAGTQGGNGGSFPANENIVGAGGGGGRIIPGSGGAGGYWNVPATGYNNLGGDGGGAGGGGGGSAGASPGTPNPPINGYGGSGGGGGSAGSVGTAPGSAVGSPNFGVTGGGAGGGGGGWGAAGADGAIYSAPLKKSLGGAGGKAIALNGYTATRSGPGTTYGTVA